MRRWPSPCFALAAVALLVTACAEPEALTRPAAAPVMARHDRVPLPGYLTPAPAGPVPPSPSQPPAMASAPVAPATPDWDGVLATPGQFSAWTRWNDGVTVSKDGGTTIRMDDLYFHSDGRWSRRVGDNFQHSDGSTTVKHGDTFFHSDGSWRRRVGETVMTSNGRTCTILGGLMACP